MSSPPGAQRPTRLRVRRRETPPPFTAAALAAVFACTAATDCRAQHTTEPAVRFLNLTPFERQEWGTATVPFAEGAWRPGDIWEPIGSPGELEPFGARWPDGSVRFAQLTTKLHLAPGADVTIPVRRANRRHTPPFAFGPWTAANLPAFDFELGIVTASGTHTAPMRLHRIVEFGRTRLTVLFRNRVPASDLVYDLWITFFSGQDHARFELRVTAADASSPRWSTSFDAMTLNMRGAAPFFRHERYHNIVKTPPRPWGDNTALLSGPDSMYDGQALEWYGYLLFANPGVPVPDLERRLMSFGSSAFAQELYGVATNWPASGAFGPFGQVPAAPPWWSDGGLAFAEAKRADWVQTVSQSGNRWDDRWIGLQPHAGATGDQLDFGTTQLGDVVRSVLPHRIEEARFGVGEEAMRPVHFREPDGGTVRAANHPQWVTWSGRTHFQQRESPDRLGKPYPEPWAGTNNHGWTGKDNEHWSSLGLAATYLLTTSHSLRMEIDNEIELFLAGHTLPSQRNVTTNSMGAPRGVGRVMLSMAWHWLCTGRNEVRDRMVARTVEVCIPQYAGLAVPGPVKPMRIYAADARSGVQGDFWVPWQDAIGAAGLAACAAISGSPAADALATLCAINVVNHGLNVLSGPRLEVGYAVAFRPGGAALTSAELQNPVNASMTGSTGFALWCMPAIRIALASPLAAADPVLRNRAAGILAIIDAQRTPQRTGHWDRYANWEAVR